MIGHLWTALENAQETLEELIAFYVEVGDESEKKKPLKSRKVSKTKYRERLKPGKL